MQEEFDALGVDIQLHAVNEEGYDHGLPDMSALGDLPVLQDTEEENVWISWDVTFRDVYVLDSDNALVGTYNLTSHSLAEEANYEELKAMLLDASAR